MQKNSKFLSYVSRLALWKKALAIVVVIGLGFYFLKGGAKSGVNGTTFTARRGPLDITVLEGGSIQALESQEAKCEVRVGYQGIKILKIVEEGYQVTEEDIKTNKVLVELDSSELRKQITQQDITFESTAATLIDAQQAYDIQMNQNLSDIKAAEQKAKFARMDFEKFLGDKATQEIIDQLGLAEEKSLAATNAVGTATASALASTSKTNAPPADGNNLVTASSGESSRAIEIKLGGGVEKLTPAIPDTPARSEPELDRKPQAEVTHKVADPPVALKINVDFAKYANIEVLGDGEAKQKIRKLKDDSQVAQKELGQAKVTLDGTQRLFAKGFVTKTDLERDDIAHENNRLKVQTAETARDLFLKYEFPKSAEEFLSKYAEAMRELDRARKAAISKLAQAEARLKSSEGQYNLQLRQRKELYEQVEKCIIRAKKPGLVVYGSGGEDMFYYGGEERIREGATVRERQAIITIPDMTKMALKVKIHETYIKKVKKGQKVRITADAFPDKVMEGEVTKVGVLPDSQNRWMNPDLKVYLTTIAVNGVQDWIKPGMSAKAEIMVKQLPDVVYVPIQAVTPSEGKQVCYVDKNGRQDRREVEIGDFNDEFIEIKKGIKEGEKVCLRAPENTGGEEGDNDKKSDEAGKEKSKSKEKAPASIPTTPEKGKPPAKV